MNFFKDIIFTWWQMGLLKIALLFIGLAIGANWPEIFIGYSLELMIIEVALGLYLIFVWLKRQGFNSCP